MAKQVYMIKIRKIKIIIKIFLLLNWDFLDKGSINYWSNLYSWLMRTGTKMGYLCALEPELLIG